MIAFMTMRLQLQKPKVKAPESGPSLDSSKDVDYNIETELLTSLHSLIQVFIWNI